MYIYIYIYTFKIKKNSLLAWSISHVSVPKIFCSYANTSGTLQCA